MIESGQLLERFRHLSREIQNGLQTAQKQLEPLKKTNEINEISKLGDTLSRMNESWLDFSGWILVSTLEDISEARSNCAPGRIDTQSKILRSKLRRHQDTIRNGISINVKDAQSAIIETFIPYFEQLLDLLFNNAVKYSPRGGEIDVACERKDSGVRITISSIGPTIDKLETTRLGERGFRSANAMRHEVAGQGYGLYNCFRLAELLSIRLEIRPESKILYESNGVPQSNFIVHLYIPNSPDNRMTGSSLA
jgi:signal transduction histidine kinase